MKIKAKSSIDGWRMMIIEMNGQRRDLQIDFPNEDQRMKFLGMVERMSRPPRVQSTNHKATITFNHYRYETSINNHDRQPTKISPVTAVAPA